MKSTLPSTGLTLALALSLPIAARAVTQYPPQPANLDGSKNTNGSPISPAPTPAPIQFASPQPLPATTLVVSPVPTIVATSVQPTAVPSAIEATAGPTPLIPPSTITVGAASASGGSVSTPLTPGLIQVGTAQNAGVQAETQVHTGSRGSFHPLWTSVRGNEARINAAERSGQLQADQAAQLRAELKGIRDRYKLKRESDGGRLSAAERAQLKAELDAQRQRTLEAEGAAK